MNQTIKTEFDQIFSKADDAGKRAVIDQECNGGVDPMVVTDGSQSWYVPEGPCGFAWVVVRPGNCRFAKYLKDARGAHKHYYGGVCHWISQYGQSVQKKEAYAQAFAEVLKEHGIQASAGSRLD